MNWRHEDFGRLFDPRNPSSAMRGPATSLVTRRAAVLSLAVAAMLSGCKDDSKELCHSVASRYEECAPKIIAKAVENVPDQFKEAVGDPSQLQREKIQTMVTDLRTQCDSGKFTKAETVQFRQWRACVKLSCDEFTSCISGKK